MKNYTHILNEGFDSYFKKLDEAVPRDLMSKIQDTDKYRQYQLDKYSDNPNIRDNHEPLDYQSANMEEITSKDVLQMKKDGNDLSNIYILDSNDNLIELDKDGYPLKGGSTGRPRANQSLNKTLSDAKKIYIGKIDYVSKTQPDKWAERTSDTSRRGSNLELGSKHSNNNWKSNFYNDLEKYGKEINRLKKAYEKGNISKKYMEKKISELKRDRDRGGSWDEYMYSLTKDGRAFDRYYDSNIASRENTDAYEEAKVAINLSNRIIEYCERELAKNSSKEKAKELKREINIEKQRIKDNQAVIDKLLHRNKNESLKRKSSKRLNETSTALPEEKKRQPNRDYLINTLMWGDIKGAILNGDYEKAAELLRNFADVLEQLAVDPYKQFNVEITLKSKLDGKSIFKSPKEKIKWLEDVLGDDASVSKVGPNTFNVMIVVDKYDDEAEDRISKTMEDYSSIISQYKISDLETL